MQTLRDLTVLILAGGLGTRLRSVVPDRPKVLADVGGRPFLAYLLDQLDRLGVRKVILCTGYMGDEVRKAFHDSYRGIRLSYSTETTPLGTGGALRQALSLVESETVLAMNGDSYCDADLHEFWSWHCERGANASLLLCRMENARRFGRVEIDDEGRLLRFEEKIEGDKRPGWINGGIYLIKHELLEGLPAKVRISIEKDVFPSWIGRRLYGYTFEGDFLDIGTAESYAVAEEFFNRIRSR